MTTSGVAFVVKLLCIPVRLEVVNWNNLDFSIQTSEFRDSDFRVHLESTIIASTD